MELFIFSGLVAAFGVGAVWATRPARIAHARIAHRDGCQQAGPLAHP
jgi:hypothetical protein